MLQDLPDGNWYCSRCTCRICGDLVSNSSNTLRGLECKQCETKCKFSFSSYELVSYRAVVMVIGYLTEIN